MRASSVLAGSSAGSCGHQAALEGGLEDGLLEPCGFGGFRIKRGHNLSRSTFIFPEQFHDNSLFRFRRQRKFHNDETNLSQMSNVRRNSALTLEATGAHGVSKYNQRVIRQNAVLCAKPGTAG